jgi:ADP-ribose pyrophosphatase YjhB (NUDIX family)
MPLKNSHCTYCGQPFADAKRQAWPRKCASCQNVSFVNPVPVAVILQPVDKGLLLIRRNIEPGKGKLALPGGYIDLGESWQAACARELFEETGLTIDPQRVRLFDVHSTLDGSNILIFGRAAAISAGELPTFRPTTETSEMCIVEAPLTLAFPLHTQMMRSFFERRRVG